MNVLTVNPGSSSLKLALVDADDHVVAAHEQATDGHLDTEVLDRFVAAGTDPDAVAVRLVHGGDVVCMTTLVDRALLERLRGLAELAPLHDPAALDALGLLSQRLPNVPLVVCVDTAFHATIPDAATTYAIPWEWTSRYGIRKYGFHGLSHQYASRRAAQLLGRPPASLRLVTCHLGAGASLAAVSGGASVDTTMGFTPLDGLVMATRVGSVDPGIVTWVQRNLGLSAGDVEDQLVHASGLLGISGRSGDLRDVVAAADRGDARARLAVDVMLHRLVTAIGGMTAAAGGIDALVFTGAIGERSAHVRRATVGSLAFLGLAIAPTNELVASADVDISTADSRVATLVIHAREDLELAREARALLDAP